LLALALACGSAAPRAVAAQADRVVVLVRHAEKADEPRTDPPLTDGGRARAGALAAALEGARVSAVVVTPYRRTRATAEPLLRATGLTPIELPVAGGLADHVRAVADTVRHRAPGETVVVVGHSNTIPPIIRALGGPDLLFVLTLPAQGAARLIRASYGAADPPGARDCDAAGRRMEP
jgi:broad specificity phosphatase PhoE